jgi:hypothetical protein
MGGNRTLARLNSRPGMRVCERTSVMDSRVIVIQTCVCVWGGGWGRVLCLCLCV